MGAMRLSTHSYGQAGSGSGWNVERFESAGERLFVTLSHGRNAPLLVLRGHMPARRRPGAYLAGLPARRMRRAQDGKIKSTRVGQMLELDVAQRRKNGLRTDGKLPFPVCKHLLDGNPLQVVLGTAQLAGDDRKSAATRVALDITFGNIRQRADDNVAPILRQQLRRHRLEAAPEEEIEEQCL